MGKSRNVFVDLAFQTRLNSCSDFFKAEVFLFTQLLEEYGSPLLSVPGYSLTVPAEAGNSENERIHIWVKLRDSWTPLWLEAPQPGIYVLFDH